MAMRVLLAGVSALILAGCNTMGGLYGHDEFSNYTERKDTITLGAGDASKVNAVTHTNSYWARHTADRQMDTNAARQVKAIECYEKRQGAGQPVTRSQTNTTIDANRGTAQSQTDRETKNEC